MIALVCEYTFASIKPEIFVQMGHRTPVHDLAFSDNRRYIISCSMEEVLMWGVSSGRQFKSFKPDDDILMAGIRKSKHLQTFFDIQKGSISFSDNKYMAYVDKNDAVSFILADKTTSKLLKNFKVDNLMLEEK